jgi:predicted nuclease with RNAse H fold
VRRFRRISILDGEAPVVVGLDAPLSYEPGGGQRVRDKKLRKEIVQRGLRPGAVMAPMAPRMVYLTLRGIVLAQVLSALRTEHQVRVVEVHPGASLSFRDAPLDAILTFSTDETAREALLEWLPSQHIQGIRPPAPCGSHFVAACAGQQQRGIGTAVGLGGWRERSSLGIRMTLPCN